MLVSASFPSSFRFWSLDANPNLNRSNMCYQGDLGQHQVICLQSLNAEAESRGYALAQTERGLQI